jgi:hypothetical protein
MNIREEHDNPAAEMLELEADAMAELEAAEEAAPITRCARCNKNLEAFGAVIYRVNGLEFGDECLPDAIALKLAPDFATRIRTEYLDFVRAQTIRGMVRAAKNAAKLF